MRRLTLITVIGLMLTACQVKMDQSTVVNGDETGTISVFMGFDEELKNLMATSGEDPFEEAEANAPEGFTASRTTMGDFEGVVITGEFENLEKFAEMMEASNDSGDSAISGEYSITREGDIFTYRVDLDAMDMSDFGGDAGLEGMDLSTLFDITVSVKLPGKVTSNNADETSADGTLVWNINPTAGERVLQAQSDASASSSSNMIYYIIGAVVLLGLLAWFMTKKKDTDGVDTTDTGTLPPPPAE